jgi:Beta-propeller repeat
MNCDSRTLVAAALVGCGFVCSVGGWPADAGAQPTQAWVTRYAGAGSGSDRATAIAFDDAGNVYVTGQSVNGAAGIDYVTVKYDALGVQQWVRSYNGPGNNEDFPNAIAVDDAGNVYVTGASYGSGAFNPPEFAKDIATVKYDTNGNEQWVARYTGIVNAWDEGLAIAVDDAGLVYVTGRSNNSPIWFDFDFVTINYDALGVERWVARFNGPGDDWDEAHSIALDGDNNVYVTGQLEQELGTAFLDYATIKYNSSGAQQWVATYNGTGDNSDIASDVDVDGAGNVYVTGLSATSTGQNWEFATVKYNSAGVEQWASTYNNTGASPDVARFIAVGADGSVHVSGPSTLDYATVKYDTDGTEQWVRRLATPGDDIPGGIALDGAGSVYVTGWSAANYATVKYTAAGTQEWVATFNGPASAQDSASAIAVDPEGTFYVTGSSTGIGTGPDYATIKYTQASVGVEPGIGGASSGVVLAQNHPNPFRALTTIAFEAPALARENVTLRVYDAGGREVATLFDGPASGAARTVTWDAAGQPSGAYFYRLEAGEIVRTGKMVLMR